MKIVYYVVGLDHREKMYLDMAAALVASIRQHMPQAQVIQMSDERTPASEGVHRVDRAPMQGPLMIDRARRMTRYTGDVLLLDPDMIVQSDVSPVFNYRFDVAVTNRDRPLIRDGRDETHLQPFNGGVVFSRNPDFWHEVVRLMEPMTPKEQKWYGYQVALAKVVNDPRFETMLLKGALYNYSPEYPTEDLSGRHIVHYKGMRKKWMTPHLFKS